MLSVCGFSRSGKLCLPIKIVSTILMQNSIIASSDPVGKQKVRRQRQSALFFFVSFLYDYIVNICSSFASSGKDLRLKERTLIV